MTEGKLYDVTQARLALEQDEQARVAEFNAIVTDAARRLRVMIVGNPVFTQDGRVVAEVRVVAQR